MSAKEKEDKAKDREKKLKLKVVVNTEDVHVKAAQDELLSVVAQDALQKSQSKSRPLADFDLKDSRGEPLDQTQTVGYYKIADEDTLYLTLKAGITGTRG